MAVARCRRNLGEPCHTDGAATKGNDVSQGTILRDVTVVYNPAWLAEDEERSGIEPSQVDLEILKRVFREGLETFIAAEEGLPISAVDDATATRSYEILIDGERPSDTTDEQELEYNTEKAIERYFQLGTYWKAYRNQTG